VASPPPGKLVVVGTGLIGGSFALALKDAGKVDSIVGVGRSRDNLDQALRLGVVDRVYVLSEDWTAELADAALVLLATPVGEMPALFAAIVPHLGSRTIVSDAGSTKQDVIAAARTALGAAFSRFVPAHPIAGSERSGAAAASASLFRGRQVVLTPQPEIDPPAQKGQRGRAIAGADGLGNRLAAQHRVDPGQQFTRIERLGQIVVRAHF